jgi:hypothetical protein
MRTEVGEEAKRMASNFRISIHRNSDNLHLKLVGDFDGTSAHQLLNVLKKNWNSVYRVFIHTGSLKDIHPFGRHTFQQNLSDLKGHHSRILFTGDNASQIAPDRSLRM